MVGSPKTTTNRNPYHIAKALVMHHKCIANSNRDMVYWMKIECTKIDALKNELVQLLSFFVGDVAPKKSRLEVTYVVLYQCVLHCIMLSKYTSTPHPLRCQGFVYTLVLINTICHILWVTWHGLPMYCQWDHKNTYYEELYITNNSLQTILLNVHQLAKDNIMQFCPWRSSWIHLVLLRLQIVVTLYGAPNISFEVEWTW